MGGVQRYKRLLIPYLFWTIIYIAIDGIEGFSISSLVQKVFFGMSSMQMYFIIVLVELTLATPVLYKATFADNNRGLCILAVSPIYCVLTYVSFFGFGSIHFAIGRNLLPWVSFYYLGMLLAAGKINATIKKGWTIVACGVVLSLIEALVFLRVYSSTEMAVTQLKFSSLCYSFGIILLCEELHHTKWANKGSKILASIGDFSYGIFYLHPLVIWVENKFARLTGLYDLFLPLYHIGQCFFTVLTCCAIVYSIRYIDKKWGYMTTLMGFR